MERSREREARRGVLEKDSALSDKKKISAKKKASKKKASRKVMKKATQGPKKGARAARAKVARKTAEKLPIPLKNIPPSVRSALEKCTPLERRFVVHYCTDANGNKRLAAQLAGVRAGVAGGKKHQKTYANRASQMMCKAEVREAVDAWTEEFALTKAQVTMMLGDLAQVSMEPFVQINADGTLSVKAESVEEFQAHLHWIKKIKVDPETGRVLHIELHDRRAALNDLARILNMIGPDNHLHFHLHKYRRMSDEALLADLRREVKDGEIVMGDEDDQGG